MMNMRARERERRRAGAGSGWQPRIFSLTGASIRASRS